MWRRAQATQLLVNAGLLQSFDNDKMTPLHRAVQHVECLEVREPAPRRLARVCAAEPPR